MNLSYQCLNAFTNIYVSIAVFGHIASYSKGCMPYEGECNIKCLNYHKNMYLPNKVCAYWRQLHHIQLHSQTVFALSINICLQSSLCLKGKWEELVSATDFATCHLTLYLPLINLVTTIWEGHRSWSCVTVIRKKKSQPHQRCTCITCKLCTVLVCKNCHTL